MWPIARLPLRSAIARSAAALPSAEDSDGSTRANFRADRQPTPKTQWGISPFTSGAPPVPRKNSAIGTAARLSNIIR